MTRTARNVTVAAALLLVSFWSGTMASAEDYPVRPITTIVPFGAGGGLDLIVRIVAQKIPAELGQPMVVVNRPGANGLIGVNAAVEAPTDGYNLFFTSIATQSDVLIKNFPFDVLDKFDPVAQAGLGSYCLFVTSGIPVKTIAELVDYSKKNPNSLNYGAQAPSPILGMEMLKHKANIDIQAIPYAGSGPAAAALIGGQIQLLIDGAGGSNLSYVQAGQIRPLACTGRARSKIYPDIPTIQQAGYPDIVVTNTVGFWAPKGMDKDRLKKLEAAIVKASNDPATIEAVAALGYQAEGGSAQQLLDLVKAERAFFAEAAKVSNYQPR